MRRGPSFHHVDVGGRDAVEVRATRAHQSELRPLMRRRSADGSRLRRRAAVVPCVDADRTCELRAEGRVVGQLPAALAAEVHSGLLALANLEPPCLITFPVRLEWRERPSPTSVHATALVDLHDLRLLAC